MWCFQSSSSVSSIHLSCVSMLGLSMVMLLSLQVGNFCSLFGNGLFQIIHSVTLSWHLRVSFTLLSTKLGKDGMCPHLAFLARAASLVALCPFTPLAPFAVNCCKISSRKITIHILAFTIHKHSVTVFLSSYGMGQCCMQRFQFFPQGSLCRHWLLEFRHP